MANNLINYDFVKMKLLRNISLPFVPIYHLVTWTRNKLYDLDIKTSKSYDLPVICVGNLSVGGTGKTPMIEYLITLLHESNNVATLSRGYKRKTSGFQMANENSSAETIGDEPFQFYNKYRDKITVAVDSDRQNGIQKLQSNNDSLDVILLDDAFQHRKVRAGLNILLTTFNNLYVDDFVLPTGNLREPKSGADRANIIIVTKCPETLSITEKSKIIRQLKPNPSQHVFFSSIKYANKVVNEKESIKLDKFENFTLVTGIANAKPLVDYLHSKNLNFKHLNFKDHHDFSKKDIELLSKENLIITTEKDFMRLRLNDALANKLYYLPIEVEIKNTLKFNNLINCFVDPN